MVSQQKYLGGSYIARCFITSTSLAHHLFLLGWLKLNLILLLDSWLASYLVDTAHWLREMNAGGSCDHCYTFLAFSDLTLSPEDYKNRFCFLVALSTVCVG